MVVSKPSCVVIFERYETLSTFLMQMLLIQIKKGLLDLLMLWLMMVVIDKRWYWLCCERVMLILFFCLVCKMLYGWFSDISFLCSFPCGR